MSRALFLDIDGVLNSDLWNESHRKEISDGVLIDEEKIPLLAALVRKTGAEIILHSGWRFWFHTGRPGEAGPVLPDEELYPLRKEAEILQHLLRREGLTIAGMTPDFSTEEIRRSRKFSLVKASEILAWLKAHREVTDWAVLDDLDLHSPEVEQRQVRTDPAVGLTKKDVRRAQEILGLIHQEVLPPGRPGHGIGQRKGEV